MNKYKALRNQCGAASLLISIILLIGMTLIILTSTKTVLNETKIAADNYRTAQATAAAQAAMDRAVSYFMEGGFDYTGTAGVVDYFIENGVDYNGDGDTTDVSPFAFTLVAGSQTTSAQFYFNNSPSFNGGTNPCDDGSFDGSDMTQGLVVAQGWSDDGTAVRTITQCLGTINIFDGGESPKQPFVSKAGVGVFGNAKIINRYSNISIWAGGPDAVHGAAYGTYLRPSGTEIGDYSTEELDSSCEVSPCNVVNNPGPNTQLVSNRNSGNGIDVITDDPSLATKTTSTTNYTDPAENEFFDMFFAQTKADIKEVAERSGRVFATGDSLDGETGLIWVDGNTNINGTDVIGSATNLAILIIDGNLDKLNGATIYGIVYVTGTLEIAGNPVVKGSIIAENPAASTGAGTLTLVFKPWGDEDGSALPFIPGTGAIIPGSWKDW